MSSPEPSATEQSANRLPILEPTTPADIDDAYTHWLRMSRAELVATTPDSDTLYQTGGAYLPGQFVVGPLQMAEPVTESLIETFVIDGDGRCTATGTDDWLNAQWMPIVSTMATKVIAELANREISIDWPAYLTASLTRLDQVTTTPHFDNDQYLPDAGVDIVAIAANYDGTRLATSPILSNNPGPGLPVALSTTDSDRFLSGTMATQQAAPDRIVIFPQFGQLHGGPLIGQTTPGLEPPHLAPIRHLMVFRATSLPS